MPTRRTTVVCAPIGPSRPPKAESAIPPIDGIPRTGDDGGVGIRELPLRRHHLPPPAPTGSNGGRPRRAPGSRPPSRRRRVRSTSSTPSSASPSFAPRPCPGRASSTAFAPSRHGSSSSWRPRATGRRRSSRSGRHATSGRSPGSRSTSTTRTRSRFCGTSPRPSTRSSRSIPRCTRRSQRRARRSGRPWPRAWRRRLTSCSRPFVIVLDNVELLRRGDASAVVLALAKSLPDGSVLALSGRTPPPLPIARLAAAGWDGRARHRGARVRPPGGAAPRPGRRAEARRRRQVAELVARTEGWPAGLHLAALALDAARLRRPAASTAPSATSASTSSPSTSRASRARSPRLSPPDVGAR